MKKQILSFAAIAILAVGAAVASSTSDFNVKEITDLTPDCKERQPCHPSDIANCEINGTVYIGDSQQTGDCNQLMEFDQ